MNKNQNLLYVITAPSGAGKTSLVYAMVDKLPNMVVSVSYTTRPKRPNEVDGVHYNFISQSEFEEKINAGEFLEYAKVFGCYYGTSLAWVQDRLLSGCDVILEIDWQGAQQIVNAFKNSLSIFILPPSLDELKNRLIAREQDSAEVISKRLREAVIEISHYHEFDYLVVNDDFDRAFADLNAIVRCQQLKQEVQSAQLQQLLSNLLNADGK